MVDLPEVAFPVFYDVSCGIHAVYREHTDLSREFSSSASAVPSCTSIVIVTDGVIGRTNGTVDCYYSVSPASIIGKNLTFPHLQDIMNWGYLLHSHAETQGTSELMLTMTMKMSRTLPSIPMKKRQKGLRLQRTKTS
jgi:hypothetical protein